MERDLKKNIVEYEKMVKEGRFHHTDLLSVEDMFRLINIAKENAPNSENIIYEAVLTAWDAGYMSGYKRGVRSTRKKYITDTQAKKIKALYTPEEISSILKRLKKGTLSEITKEQADRIISKHTD